MRGDVGMGTERMNVSYSFSFLGARGREGHA